MGLRQTKDAVQGRWALVTGASSGLGREFASQLSAMGMNIAVVARREERLNQVQAELESRDGTTVRVYPADLSRPEEIDRMLARLEQDQIRPLVLVNNAGYGVHGSFLQIPWERESTMLQLDIVSLVYLTRRCAEQMVEDGNGYILQISSIGAYQSSPTYASYTAAKSFVLHYGEAIHHELSGTGVTCTVLSPGVTATEFLDVAGQKPTLYQRLVMMDSPTVVSVGLRALFRGRLSVLPGVVNKATAFLVRFLPRRWVVTAAARVMR
jgi:uncharacterized protein